jgi:hypothetical protein
MPRLPDEIVPVLERFNHGASLIREAINGIDARTISRPGPESWSIRDVLVHLADAELVRSVRIRYILAEEEPLLVSFDEGLWKRRLQYLWRSPEASLALFDQSRYSTTELLRQIDAKSWERFGVFPDGDTITVAELLRRGANHSEEHATQIKQLRGILQS